MTIAIDLPAHITHEQVAAAIQALGIGTDARITGIHMNPVFVDVRGTTPEGTEYSHRYLITEGTAQ